MAAYLNIYGLFLCFNLLSLGVLGLIIATACQNITNSPTNVIIYNAYTGCLCLLLFVAEFHLPRFVHEYLLFLCTYRGRGLLYTFFGCLVYAPHPFNIAACIIVVATGVFFFIISWVRFPSPSFGIIANWRAWCHQGTRDLYRRTTTSTRQPHSNYISLPPPQPGGTSHDHCSRRRGDEFIEYDEHMYLSQLRDEEDDSIHVDRGLHMSAVNPVPPTAPAGPPSSTYPRPHHLTAPRDPPSSSPVNPSDTNFGAYTLESSGLARQGTTFGTPTYTIQTLTDELERQYPHPLTSAHPPPGTSFIETHSHDPPVTTEHYTPRQLQATHPEELERSLTYLPSLSHTDYRPAPTNRM
ncbi:hypothetical protein IWQ62_001976 [Dispira parvispora]|uniref:Uncharacterized protein n=1 Tax=Dispira parvispora TaxID=1520584 RepID=A0A9W8AR97_9FUNG|nr:hypothetical protein IWQ62_001976 [Dispira parvispora]